MMLKFCDCITQPAICDKPDDVTDEEMVLLHFACLHQNDGMTQGDPTVLTCWDAGRLDLSRAGITPRARYLGTEAARSETSMDKANRRTHTCRDVYDARHDSN
jgi:uncharacterized protein